MIKFVTLLLKKHKKHLPKTLEGTVIGELLKYGISIFLSAWIFQGIRYMNWRESLIKGFIDILLTLIFTLSGIHIVSAIIIAHTLNFAFNGQLYVMYNHMGATNTNFERDTIFVNIINIFLKNNSFYEF